MTPSIQLNPHARNWALPPSATTPSVSAEAVLAFHKQVPGYNETPLHTLPDLASSLGLGHVLLKDESDRFGLPAFKILGASWAVYRAVCSGLNLGPATATSPDSSNKIIPFADIGAAAREKGIHIITLTEGNCGRAVARMAAGHLGLRTTVYVPSYMDALTRSKIRGEGADVVEVAGSYDDVIPVALAAAAAEADNAIMVMDVGVEGCDEVPRYFVQGYGTMLAESDRQVLGVTGDRPATHAVVPVGAGSIGEAVTAHFKSAARSTGTAHRPTKVIAVEPTTAACLFESLKVGKSVSVPTGDTIMCGMNCGTLSTTAWPVLRDGMDASVTITDLEAHDAVRELTARGIHAGPCGAATLAALKRLCEDHKKELDLDENSVVVLYCTEGTREYLMPS